MYSSMGPSGDRTSPAEPAQGRALFGVSRRGVQGSLLRHATEFSNSSQYRTVDAVSPRYSDWVHSIALYAVVLFLVLRKIYASFDVRDGRPVGFDIRLG